MARLTPYLSFRDQAREALEFYRTALGGELEIMTFGSMPGMTDDPAEEELVMHGQLEAPGGLVLMAADTPSSMPYVPATSGVTVALTGGPEDMDHVQAAISTLLDGATDVMPFDPAPWGDHYGQLTDRYGITWMFDVGAS
ncbi:PhnB protein [Isoptericola sp. CG 20/1183]|uniref:PhnB protein n=1 Tax=Isoptericola halotolerans TaxID=300560 RepID=A0ABX5EFM7_9MICO|nr:MULTISPECIES: VOC family protein [Isoptericola]PRZ08209.1 PhnB protein [Isoptericola halotolerans]PRZ09006.1 PhnB protein [Isoptericola sp. CG 20/1183]